MADHETNSDEFRTINPDDFYEYEEQFFKKGGGASAGKEKNHPQKGKKAIQSIRKQIQSRTQNRQREKAKSALQKVISRFPSFDHPDRELEFVSQYRNWVKDHLQKELIIDESNLKETRSKSGGPGGQNVNKRETQVMLLHLPTHIKTASNQTRSQRRNRAAARKQLQKRLQEHLADWKTYLGCDTNLSEEVLQKLRDDTKTS